MPGNQGSPDREVELKVSYMVKRSQGKSTLGATNFKKRVFVLTPSRLSYYEGTLEVSLLITSSSCRLYVMGGGAVHLSCVLIYTQACGQGVFEALSSDK